MTYVFNPRACRGSATETTDSKGRTQKSCCISAFMSRNSLKLRLLVQVARKPLRRYVEMRFVMDMFSPSVYESTFYRVQEPIVPASGVQAEDGECKALRDLAALGDRVLAARLIV